MPKSGREIASSEVKLLSNSRIFPPRKKNALSRADIIKMQILDGRSEAISCQNGMPRNSGEIASSEVKLLNNYRIFPPRKKTRFRERGITKMQILDGRSEAISCQNGMPKSRREIASSEVKLLSNYRIFPPRKKKRAFASRYYKNINPSRSQHGDLLSRWNAKIRTGECFVGSKAS